MRHRVHTPIIVHEQGVHRNCNCVLLIGASVHEFSIIKSWSAEVPRSMYAVVLVLMSVLRMPDVVIVQCFVPVTVSVSVHCQ